MEPDKASHAQLEAQIAALCLELEEKKVELRNCQEDMLKMRSAAQNLFRYLGIVNCINPIYFIHYKCMLIVKCSPCFVLTMQTFF